MNFGLQIFEKVARAFGQIPKLVQAARTGILRISTMAFLQFQRVSGAVDAWVNNLKNNIDVRQWLKNLLGVVNAAAPTIKKSFQKFGSMVGSVVSLENGQKLYQATVGGAMEQQKRKDMFIERAGGDKQKDKFGESMFEYYKAEALEAGVDVNDYLSTALTFMPVAQNADQISKLSKLAHRLATFDPENQGIQANGLALKEALSGDPVSMASLAKRFGMSENQVSELKLDKLAEKGDKEGFISGVDKLFEMNNMGQQAYVDMLNSPTEQVGTLVTNVKNAFAEIGQAAFQAFGKVIDNINKAFKNGKFQSFIDGMKAGFAVIANVVSNVVQFLVNNFGLVQNILVVLGIVLLVLAGIWLVQWFAALWPVFLVIAAIVLLLEILNYFGISTSQVIGFVVGVFMSLAASINNYFAVYWNILVAFAEFLANVLTDPAYALKKLFYDVFLSLHEYFSNFLNDAVNGVNWLIEKFNGFAGTEIPPIPRFEVELEKLKSDKDVVDYSNRRMGQKSTFDAIGEGQKFMNTIMPPVVGNPDDKTNEIKERVNKWTNVPKNFPPAKQPGSELPNINRVNEIGEINGTVEVAGEDLEVMRDLAEIQSIQNFVTLTPTVQVTTGDIHQPTDANEMIRRIEEVMSREIANSAQGVYA
ncbi:hypothetical protein ACFCP7_19410 [Paenibacillus elgii]